MMTKDEFETAWEVLRPTACHTFGCTNKRMDPEWKFCIKHTYGEDKPLAPILVPIKLLCDEYRREREQG